MEKATTTIQVPRKVSDETTVASQGAAKLNARIADPLHGLTVEELRSDANSVAQNRVGLSGEAVTCFEQGAVLAQNRNAYEKEGTVLFSEEQLASLEYEAKHRWGSIPKTLWFVVILNSLCAAVQGMGKWFSFCSVTLLLHPTSPSVLFLLLFFDTIMIEICYTSGATIGVLSPSDTSHITTSSFYHFFIHAKLNCHRRRLYVSFLKAVNPVFFLAPLSSFTSLSTITFIFCLNHRVFEDSQYISVY